MKKIVLTIASLFLVSGTAFAGSDHYGSEPMPATGSYLNTHSMVSGGAVDMNSTKSIGKADSAAAANSTYDIPVWGGQGIWGH